MKKQTKKVDKNAVAKVHTNCHCKGGSWSSATEISMIVSMFLSLLHWALNIFATGKRVNHVNEYGLEIHKKKKKKKRSKKTSTEL